MESRFSRALKKSFKYYLIVQLILIAFGLITALLLTIPVTVSIISLPLYLIILVITYLAEPE